MNAKQTAAITDIEDAATVRWLARTLAVARGDARFVPTDEAIDRMRTRVFGTSERPKQRQRIAA